jgi:hypothetical protein
MEQAMGMNRLLLAIGIIIVIFAVSFYLLFDTPKYEKWAITHYNVTYYVEVKNIGISPATNIPLTVGLLDSQEPYQKVIDRQVYPSPDKTYTDSIGNKFAAYEIESLSPGENFTVRVDVVFDSENADYNILKESIREMEGEQKKYTLPSKFIESNDPLIKAKAAELANNSVVIDTLWNTYSFIVEEIEYEKQPGEFGALWTLQNMEGGSAELANLFVALARANGIPARRISGWGAHFSTNETMKAPQFAHGWAEIYLPDYGWIPVDPTFGKTHKFDNFAKSDDDHIVLTRGEGIHFYTRGAYTDILGEADLDTVYTVHVNSKDVENVSTKRSLLSVLVFAVPALFLAFLAWKWKKG